MGIAIQQLQLTAFLWKDGCFKTSKSVIELGAQEIRTNPDEFRYLLNVIGGSEHSAGSLPMSRETLSGSARSRSQYP